MALRDVYEKVKELVQTQYPVSTEFPDGFDHTLTDSAGTANFFNGVPPGAVWVLPKPGDIKYGKEEVRRIGGQQRQIWAAEAQIEIHLWLPDEGDQEEDRRSGFDQESGFITNYLQALDEVVQGKEITLLDGGYTAGGGPGVDLGYVFVMRLILQFGVYRRSDAIALVSFAGIEKEIVNLEDS